MDPNPQDMDWMTERARHLIAGGMGTDEAVAQALEEGEARARLRRVKDWQDAKAVDDSLRDLDRQRQRRDDADGSAPTLKVSLGDFLKKRG
jgi:hypothetical protein